MKLSRPTKIHSITSLWGIVLILAIAACGGTRSAVPSPTATASATPFPSSTPIQITIPSSDDSTPAYVPFQPLLAKIAGVGPVYVTADRTVPDAALIDAGKTLSVMLRHRPDIAVQLRVYGAFTVVASRNETICDLSYFSQYRGQPGLCTQFGEGGAGGVMGNPITACDERNLLEEPDDPYSRGTALVGQNICVHELAHTIMNVGLTVSDVSRIDEQYRAAKASGLWTGDYAMTNAMEFWAVMSQFYFHAGPSASYSAFHHIANGPTALKRYDPATFALLDSIYQGSTDLQ
jgi:hypothetical protein